MKLYNLISDSTETDDNGFVTSDIEFRAPNYYDFFGKSELKIKRMNVNMTDVKLFDRGQEITSDCKIEYSDFIESYMMHDNSFAQIPLGDLVPIPISLVNKTSLDALSLGLLCYVTKYDKNAPTGYYHKYYYSRFETPKGLGLYDLSLGSQGTPLHNVSFKDLSAWDAINVTQESLSTTSPIYLENDEFEVEYENPIIIKGAILDNDEYIVEGEVYDYNYQEALDGETSHALNVVSPLGDDNFIDREEFSIYYVNDQLEILPLFTSLDGQNFINDTILSSTKNPVISYVDNAFILNVYWKEDSSSFIDYDTNLLISYKVVIGQPLPPISYVSADSYGNSQQQNLIEIPFAKYDIITRSWETEGDFVNRFRIDKLMLSEDVESTGDTLEGLTFYEGEEVTTGVIGLDSVYVNKSYSTEFTLVNSTEYTSDIDGTGKLVISGLNYTDSGDVFRVNYYAYYPIEIPHSLTKDVSSVNHFKVINETGFEYSFVEGVDYKLSEDGYSIFFIDLYNAILKSNNFTIYDTFEIDYHSSLAKKVDLSQNILLLLQDSEGNSIPIDTISEIVRILHIWVSRLHGLHMLPHSCLLRYTFCYRGQIAKIRQEFKKA